jgi:hypothetical protein
MTEPDRIIGRIQIGRTREIRTTVGEFKGRRTTAERQRRYKERHARNGHAPLLVEGSA